MVTVSVPAALEPRRTLRDEPGAGMDPCAAIQTTFVLEPQQSTEIVFVLGEADDLNLRTI